MPEPEEPSFTERIIQAILRQLVGRFTKTVERLVRRVIRVIAMALAGVAIAALGIAFLAIGAVKWFSLLMPSWLAWAIVGVILVLLGAVLTLGAMMGSRG